MTPAKDTSKKFSTSLSDEMFNELKELQGNKSNPEFIAELLQAYKQYKGLNSSEEPKNYFPNLQGSEKAEKEPVLKEIFELEPDDSLLISEKDLLEKASKLSGKSIEEMALEGRVLVAKNEIGRQVQYRQNKGTKGKADDRIAQTYELLKQSGQTLSLNRLTQASGSNRKTVERWCTDNGITF